MGEAILSGMESQGVRLVGREGLTTSRAAFFHPKDLCGMMIELIEE